MIPTTFLENETSARFWTDMAFDTNVAHEFVDEIFRTPYGSSEQEIIAEWRLPKNFKIRLVYTPSLTVELFLIDGTEEPQTLGWDDQSHWHPHVFRRDELEKICRAIAKENPDDPLAAHPGWPVRLLDRFAPLCDDDDVQQAYESLFTAHRQRSQLTEPVIVRLTHRSDCRGNGFHWNSHPDLGWCIDQVDEEGEFSRSVYSIRHYPVQRSPEQEEALQQLRDRGLLGPESHFPFGSWNRCLQAIEATLAKVNAEPYQGVASEPIHVPKHYSVSIHYAEPYEPQPSESPLFSKLFTNGLNAMLRDQDLGTATNIGGGHKKLPDGRKVSTGLHDQVTTTLPFPRLLDLVRQWFAQGGPVQGAGDQPRPTMTKETFSNPYADDLHDAAEGPLLFNLVRLNVTQSRWGLNVRREPINDETRTEIANKFRSVGVSAAWRSVEDEGDGITIEVDSNVRSDALKTVWKLMCEHELILLPHLIAPSDDSADRIQVHQDYVKRPKSLAEFTKTLTEKL